MLATKEMCRQVKRSLKILFQTFVFVRKCFVFLLEITVSHFVVASEGKNIKKSAQCMNFFSTVREKEERHTNCYFISALTENKV